MFDEAKLDEFLDHQGVVEHYGVKGMKWGVRKRQDKAARRAKRVDKYASRTKALDAKINIEKSLMVKNRYQARKRDQRVAVLMKERANQQRNVDAAEKGHLTPKQKKILIGAGVTAAIIGGGIAYGYLQSGEGNRLLMNGRAFIQNGGKKGTFAWNENRRLKDVHSADAIFREVVPDINPSTERWGAKMNCRRCTMAYEMRRRGLDVAATRTSQGAGQDVGGMFNLLHPEVDRKDWVEPGQRRMMARIAKETLQKEKGKPAPFLKYASELEVPWGEHVVEPNHLFDEIKRLNPNGARGELGVQWEWGGGHSIAWEVIDGKTHIFDTQMQKHFTSQKQLEDYYGMRILQSGITRLDDKPLNEEFLKRWLKNAA